MSDDPLGDLERHFRQTRRVEDEAAWDLTAPPPNARPVDVAARVLLTLSHHHLTSPLHRFTESAVEPGLIEKALQDQAEIESALGHGRPPAAQPEPVSGLPSHSNHAVVLDLQVAAVALLKGEQFANCGGPEALRSSYNHLGKHQLGIVQHELVPWLLDESDPIRKRVESR